MTKRTSCLCVLEGGLLRSSCCFPYLFLLAFEAGSIFRAFLVLFLAYPLSLVCKCLLASEPLSHQVLFFITFCGLRESSVRAVARAVLPKFFLEDLRRRSYKEVMQCGRRSVIALSTPAMILEPFLRDYLEVDHILSPIELRITAGGYCTGLISRRSNAAALPSAELGICTPETETLISGRCKEAISVGGCDAGVTRDEYPKPLIFHDGRLAVRPTPAMALAIFLWLPIGIALAIPRTLILVLCPSIPIIILCEAALGIAMRYRGNPRQDIPGAPEYPREMTECPGKRRGNLYVCSHRTLLDPVILSGMVGQRVTAVTYSISRLTELLSPIRTVRLTRCRWQDAATIGDRLDRGDLIVCPEGTTCREPYLLRFSKLFVEIAHAVVPVAIDCRVQLFHATSVRGWKAMDPLFFALNPRPRYEVQFLDGLNLRELASQRGMTSLEIANMIQRRIADALCFECTGYTRKDKYRLLAGNDGSRQRIRNVLQKPSPASQI